MSREFNSQRSDCKISEPHTTHPASSNSKGDVAAQKSPIIFLFNKGLVGAGGKSTFISCSID